MSGRRWGAQVHRIPIVDPEAKLIGIVTRTDIFTALGKEASPDVKSALT
jgi:CBS-domain-containing membrane protein